MRVVNKITNWLLRFSVFVVGVVLREILVRTVVYLFLVNLLKVDHLWAAGAAESVGRIVSGIEIGFHLIGWIAKRLP